MSMHRQLEHLTNFFAQFKIPYSTGQTLIPSTGVAQFADRKKLIRILRSCVKHRHLRPVSNRQKQGVRTITLELTGIQLATIEVSYINGSNECVMHIKQEYDPYRSYSHRLNASGIY